MQRGHETPDRGSIQHYVTDGEDLSIEPSISIEYRCSRRQLHRYRSRVLTGGTHCLEFLPPKSSQARQTAMGQGNSSDLDPLSPPSSPRLIDRHVNKNPDFVRYSRKNSKNIEELLKWSNDEFNLHQYSREKISDPFALWIEIRKKCTDKLEEEWVNFGFYPEKKEKLYKLCMFASMVNVAEVNLKIKEVGTT